MDPLLKAVQSYLSATEGNIHYTEAQYYLRQQLRAVATAAEEAERELAAAAEHEATGALKLVGGSAVEPDNDDGA